MEVKLSQLEEKIRNSKCATCGLLLSVGPLMVMSEDGSQIRCGRCKEIKCQTSSRNILYENIAEALTFPCSYKQCKKGIPWGQVEEHEKICRFRTVYCPVYYQRWCNNRIIEVANLRSHFIQEHRANLKLGNISHKLSVSQQVVFLLIVDNLKFFVYLSNETNNFLFNVFSLDPLDKYIKYNVQIRSDKNVDTVVSYLNQKIIQFNEKEHCYKCWRRECNLKCHPRAWAYRNTMLFDSSTICHKIDRRLFDLLDNAKELIIKIDLIAEQKQQDSEDTTTTSCQCHKNEDKREEAAVDKKQEKIELPC